MILRKASPLWTTRHVTTRTRDSEQATTKASSSCKILRMYMPLGQNVKLLCLKDTIKQMKREPTEGEKMFAKHESDKELITRKYKKFLQLNNF